MGRMARSIQRNMARQRLEDAGYERVNKRLGVTMGKSRQAEASEKYHRGRKNSRRRAAYLAKMRKAFPPVWRRVTEGDLAKKAVKAFKKASLNRAMACEMKRQARRMKATEVGKWEPAEEP